MPPDDLESAIEQSHFALSEIVKGNVEPFLSLHSEREDMTIGNPFGSFARGRQKVREALHLGKEYGYIPHRTKNLPSKFGILRPENGQNPTFW